VSLNAVGPTVEFISAFNALQNSEAFLKSLGESAADALAANTASAAIEAAISPILFIASSPLGFRSE
jgi:hypothetical protein